EPATSEMRVPGPEAAFLPLHARDRRSGLRCSETPVPQGGENALRQFRPGQNRRFLLRGRLDPTFGGRAIYPDGGDHSTAARQHRAAGRWNYGAPGARVHSGFHGHPDALQPAARLPADRSEERRVGKERRPWWWTEP